MSVCCCLQPTEQDGQHFGPEMREYLAEARSRFADSLAILEALREYEGTAGQLLLDD